MNKSKKMKKRVLMNVFVNMLLIMLFTISCSIAPESQGSGEGNDTQEKPEIRGTNGTPGTAKSIVSGTAGEWQLVFSDEFNYNGAPDPNKWTYDLGIGVLENGWGNWEKQYYTDDPENVRVENGNLIIEAHLDQNHGYPTPDPDFWIYTSGRLTTRGTAGEITYGKIEIRADLPSGRGTWPAGWTVGKEFDGENWPGCGEIDILEHVGTDPTHVLSGIHCETYNWQSGTAKNHTKYVPTAETDFHIYTLEWDEDKIEIFIDGVKHFTFANEGTGPDEWPFDSPQYLILNIAVGGSWGGNKGIDNSIFPQQMLVDYVRIYQRQVEYKIESRYSGKCIDISDVSYDWGANIHQWDYVGGENQKWFLIPVDADSDTYKIISKHSGLALDAAGADSANGTNLIQWPYGGINQEWIVTDLNNGYYSIINKNTGGAVDVADWSYDNGGNIHLWQYYGSDNQQWAINPVSDVTNPNVLESGVTVTSSLSGTDETEMWEIEVPSSTTSMNVSLTCGSADYDVYGSFETEPTTSSYDFRGYTSGGENVTYNTGGNTGGTYYIMVRSYSGAGDYNLTVNLQ